MTTQVEPRERKPRVSKGNLMLTHRQGQELLYAIALARPHANQDFGKILEKLEQKLWDHARKTIR
jgi:hypothetical protein